MDTNWFIARDRKKHGPYSLDQMQQMARGGQLLPTDMVFQEGTTKWLAAAEVEGIFPAAQPAPPPLPPPVPPELAEWHFTQNGQQAGPVTWTQLRQQGASGQLHPTDMVWKSGMAAWAAAITIKDLYPTHTVVPPQVPPLAIQSVPVASGEDAETHFERGQKCVTQKSFDRAISHFTKAIEHDPNYAEAYERRSMCYDRIGDENKAIADATEAIRISPTNASYYISRAMSFSNKGDNEKAIVDAKEACRLHPSNREFVKHLAEFNVLLAKEYDKRKDYGMAIAFATEGIRLTPTEPVFYYNRGNYYYAQNDYDHAIADFAKAVQLDPNDSDFQDQLKQLAVVVYYNRGMKQFNVKNYKEALPDFEKAHQIDPEDVDFQNMLDKTRRALGIKATDAGVGGASVADSPSQVPTASWPPGLYLHMNGSWHPGPKTEEEFGKLIKSKTITLDTLAVRVPENMTPVRLCDSLSAEEIEAFHRIVNQPTGFWSALKAKGFLGASANILGALDGKWTCGYCRETVRYGATICPHCRSEIGY